MKHAVTCALIVVSVVVLPNRPCLGDAEELDLKQLARIIETFITAGQYADAEPYVRKAIERAPEELYFLSQLDIVLNGEGKHQEADELRARIRALWKKSHRADWVARGSPVAESSWARMLKVFSAYEVVGAEYFEPQVVGTPPLTITSYYKVIVLPKPKTGAGRVFKLEMSEVVEENYFLRELDGSGTEPLRASYGVDRPNLRRVFDDVIAYMESQQND